MQTIDLNDKPRSGAGLASWYAGALEVQSSSGLSMAEFADEIGVSVATLYQWKRRLSPDDHAEFETPRSLGLVEVSLPGRPQTESGPVVVRLSSGRYLEVPRRFDDDDLIRLVQLLESC